MKMKSVSIPEDLYAYLYTNINADRKSLYSVIEWLRDCKEHSDRVGVFSDQFEFNKAIEPILLRGCKGIHCRDCLMTKNGKTAGRFSKLCDAISDLRDDD